MQRHTLQVMVGNDKRQFATEMVLEKNFVSSTGSVRIGNYLNVDPEVKSYIQYPGSRVRSCKSGVFLPKESSGGWLCPHAQFNNPSVTDISIPVAGQITSTSVNPRLIQFALKYAF